MATRLDHGFDLSFEVVALVDHEGGLREGLIAGEMDLMEDAEDLVGVDGAEGEVVVGVAAVVEVEAAEQIGWRSQATICSMFCAA